MAVTRSAWLWCRSGPDQVARVGRHVCGKESCRMCVVHVTLNFVRTIERPAWIWHDIRWHHRHIPKFWWNHLNLNLLCKRIYWCLIFSSIHPEYRTGIRRQRISWSSVYVRWQSSIDRSSKNQVITYAYILFRLFTSYTTFWHQPHLPYYRAKV